MKFGTICARLMGGRHGARWTQYRLPSLWWNRSPIYATNGARGVQTFGWPRSSDGPRLWPRMSPARVVRTTTILSRRQVKYSG